MTYAGAETTFERDADDLLTKAGNFNITRSAENGSVEAVGDTGAGGTFNATFGLNGFGELETQLTQVNGTDIFSLSLQRNKGGQIIAKTEVIDGETTAYSYAYDDLGRLLEVRANETLVEQYMYGGNGWRIWEYNSRRGITDRTFSYDAEDRLLTAGDSTYAYDADGYLRTKTTPDGVTTYTYDTRGALRAVALPDGRTIEYVIDPLGRRIAKKVDGIITEKYLWQGMTRLLAVYDGSDLLKYRFQYAGGRMPASVETDGTTYYLHYDQVGSLVALTDTDGGILKRVVYDSFGNILTDTKPAFSVLCFAGGLYDADTGLVRFGYRDYDPETGRWTSKDPIGFDGGDTDLYGYCGCDPVRLVDPKGLFLPLFLAPPVIAAAIPALETTGAILAGIITGAAIAEAIDGAEDEQPESEKPATEPNKESPCPDFPGNDPTIPPEGFEWKGKPGSTPGDKEGNYFNPETGESLRPDLDHAPPVGPHWDYKDADGNWHRLYPDGSSVPKK